MGKILLWLQERVLFANIVTQAIRQHRSTPYQ